MSELLPCPFCGAAAEVDRTEERFEYSTNGGPDSVQEYGYYTYCTKCDASMGLINVPPSTSEAAVAEWNQRAATPQLDWGKAMSHLEFYEKVYIDIGDAGRFAMALTIMPLKDRLERGERTTWLYDEIMAVE